MRGRGHSRNPPRHYSPHNSSWRGQNPHTWRGRSQQRRGSRQPFRPVNSGDRRMHHASRQSYRPVNPDRRMQGARPQLRPPPPVICPHPDCRLPVKQLDRHIRRIHTRKAWGYQCPCGFSASSVDDHLFTQHRARLHMAPRGENLNPFKVVVPGGYMRMEKCAFCDFLGFSLDHIECHLKRAHNSGDLPTYQLEPEVPPVAAAVGPLVSQPREPEPMEMDQAAATPQMPPIQQLKLHAD